MIVSWPGVSHPGLIMESESLIPMFVGNALLVQPNVDTRAVGSESFFVGHRTNGRCVLLERGLVVADHGGPLQKVVRTETVGEASRSSSR